jgi:hypothetical protein
MALLITAFLVAFAYASDFSGPYFSCIETKCPAAYTWVTTEAPSDWGTYPEEDIALIGNDATVATGVDCVCNSCSGFEGPPSLESWPAYSDGACDHASYYACIIASCPGAFNYDYPENFGDVATDDLTNIAENPGIATHVDCVCNRCSDEKVLETWPANAGNAACTTAANKALPTSATPPAWTKDDPALCENLDEDVFLKKWLEAGVQCSCKFSDICSGDNPFGKIYNDYTLEDGILEMGLRCPNQGACAQGTPAPPETVEISPACHPTLLGLVALVALM